MDQGTLGELYLTRSVTKHIRKYNKAVAVGVGVGKDYSMVDTKGCFMVQSEGLAETPYIAWVKSTNNLVVSGGQISGVRICYMLPTTVTEEQIKDYAGQFNALAEKLGIQIIGGNTKVSSAYIRASFLVEAIGILSADSRMSLKAKEDYQIVMVGYTGVLGTNLIVDEKGDELKERFAPSYVNGCRFSDDDCSIMAMADAVNNCKDEAEVVYMHDVSYGGLYGGLWQLGQALNLGMTINHRSIPIKQETIEICNYFDVNPYMLEGTGALLVVARDGNGLAEHLRQAGYMASSIGKLTQNKDRVVVLNAEGEKRFLAPVKGDEIYKVIAGY